MTSEQLKGWPVVQVTGALLSRDAAQLLRWVSSHGTTYSLVIDARAGEKPPHVGLASELELALARCVRMAVCVGSAAALGIVWHHRLRGLCERRLFVDFQRGVTWAREPHRNLRVTWNSMAPLRPSYL